MAGINLHDVDLWRTMKKCVDQGGAIFYDRVPTGTVNATATGTGTSRTSISTSYAVPPIAKEILAISPGLASTADAAADLKLAMVDIQGTAFKRQPQQVLAPVGSSVLSVGATRFTPQEWYKVCAPVVAGDLYDYGVTPLVANAHNMKAWIDVMYSTVPSNDPVIFSQVSTASAFKAAGSQSSGTLTLTAASGLYEVASATSGESAVVAQENQIATHILQCSALQPIQQLAYGSDTPAQVAATSGDDQMGQIIRYPTYGMSFKIPNPTLTYNTILNVATTNNMNVAHMARYTTY
jgi:hypothetical protein